MREKLTFESTSYTRKPELRFVSGVMDGAIHEMACAVSRLMTVPLFA